MGLPWWLSGKESVYQCRRHRFESLDQEDPTCLGKLGPCTTTIPPVLWSLGAANY